MDNDDYRDLNIDVKKLFAPWGSPNQVARVVSDAGIADVSGKTIEKWIQRGSIPDHGIIIARRLYHHAGKHFDIEIFVTKKRSA